MENSEILNNRIDYYSDLAKKYFDEYPSSFEGFVDDKDAIMFGDDILKKKLSTGYNFVHKDYPLPNEEGVILYSVYSQRHKHFGTVLANMESLGIITEKNFEFFAKGTKIVGNYFDPELKKSSLLSKNGEVIETLESVEGTIAFYPDNEVQAIEIAAFLMKEAPKIQGGYLDPDVRATYDFNDLLGGIGLKKAMANIVSLESGAFIMLRQKSKIELPGWIGEKTLINQELYQFLASNLVDP